MNLFHISCIMKTPDFTRIIQNGSDIYLSNKSMITDTDIFLNLLRRLWSRKHALLAWSANFAWAWVISPFDDKVMPKYDIAVAVCNTLSPNFHCRVGGLFPLRNTMIFDFSVFSLSFHFSQYSYSLSISTCNVSLDSANITTSSAYKRSKSLIKPIDTPAPGTLRCCSRSLMYNENKNGDKHSPCLTPRVQ